jgi:hypothetical protein
VVTAVGVGQEGFAAVAGPLDRPADALAAQTSAVSSAYRKIFEPKPPPTSGAMTRIFDSGMPSTKAHISSRSTCGFWFET